MKKLFIILLLCSINILHGLQDAQVVPESAFLIDTIQAVLFGQGGAQVVTRSEVMKPNLAGMQQSLDDIIFERLVFLDAKKYNIMPDDDAVDKYLAMVQKENNLTLDQLKDIFISSGYTYEEGRQQFRILQTVNSMLGLKIHSQVIVPRAQVEAYYREHPVVQEAEYSVQYGFMSYIPEKRDKQEKALRYMARTGKELKSIEWHDPFWIKQGDVADDKAFIFSLTVGEMSQPVASLNGYEMYRLVDKHDAYTPSLDERYHEIANILRRPVYEQLMEKYKKSLFDTVSILSLD